MGHAGSVGVLLEFGADKEAMMPEPPLWFAHTPFGLGLVSPFLWWLADRFLPRRGPTLWIAAHQGHVEVVQVLLQSGANTRAWANGKTALWAAQEFASVVQVLYKAGADASSLLCSSAIADDLEISGRNLMGQLLGLGANIEARWKKPCETGFHEGTPLFYRVLSGSAARVKVLLAAGADKEARGTVYENGKKGPDAHDSTHQTMRLPVRGRQVCVFGRVCVCTYLDTFVYS